MLPIYATLYHMYRSLTNYSISLS